MGTMGRCSGHKVLLASSACVPERCKQLTVLGSLLRSTCCCSVLITHLTVARKQAQLKVMWPCPWLPV